MVTCDPLGIRRTLVNVSKMPSLRIWCRPCFVFVYFPLPPALPSAPVSKTPLARSIYSTELDINISAQEKGTNKPADMPCLPPV